MAQCIERLAKDPARCRSMGSAGRMRALANFSIEACAAGVLRVYEEAMDRPLGGRPQRISGHSELSSHTAP
jgi:glycosyltransferase involved in cell wall biosynthesis